MATSLDRIADHLEPRLGSYIEDLAELVGIDSNTADRMGVNRVNSWLEQRLTALGYAVTRVSNAAHGDDLIACQRGTGKARILLLGHSDTVYPTGTASLRPLRTADDRILGPGVSDMKGGLIAGIYALEALQHLGANCFDRVTYLVVSDEEGAERHSTSLIEQEGAKHDTVFTLEAARENGDLVSARKALVWYEVAARGRAAHAGVEPEKGLSAALSLARFMISASELNNSGRGISVNPGLVSSTNAPNVVSDYATASFDLRATTNADLEALTNQFRALLERQSADGVDLCACQVEGSYAPAMVRTDGVIRLERLAQEVAHGLGFNVRSASTGGSSDISFAMTSGVSGLDGLGPVGGLDHSPDEYILRSSIVPRIALLAGLIARVGEGSH